VEHLPQGHAGALGVAGGHRIGLEDRPGRSIRGIRRWRGFSVGSRGLNASRRDGLALASERQNGGENEAKDRDAMVHRCLLRRARRSLQIFSSSLHDVDRLSQSIETIIEE
jgi:hypothetical protein